jgi:hypothetical protein
MSLGLDVSGKAIAHVLVLECTEGSVHRAGVPVWAKHFLRRGKRALVDLKLYHSICIAERRACTDHRSRCCLGMHWHCIHLVYGSGSLILRCWKA